VIDHLVYAAPDLQAAVADVEERFGVRARIGGRHVGRGTRNALLALGPQTYLEIIAPDPEQPEPAVPRPFGLDSVDRGRLVRWAVACEDIDAAVAGARGHGYDPGDVVDGQRAEPAGTVLRWRMTSGELADGAHPYNVPPEHTAEARNILGSGKLLCPEVWVLLETDAAAARSAARQALASYMRLDNYVNNWRRIGFGDDELAGGGSDRFIDANVAWGSEEAIRKRIQEHWDAGADHVCIQSINPDGSRRPDEKVLALLAPGGRS